MSSFKKTSRQNMKLTALFICIVLLMTSMFSPVYAGNATGKLSAEVVEIEGKYYLSVNYVSNNNSIKAGVFEVLSPDGKEVLLISPVVQFDFKSAHYMFELNEDIPAGAVIKMTEDKAKNYAQAAGEFPEGFIAPGPVYETLDLAAGLGEGNAGNIRVVEFDMIPGEAGEIFGIADPGDTAANPPITVMLSDDRFIAKNGDVFGAVNDIIYDNNQTYHFKVMINLPAGTYDIWVTEQFNDEADYSVPGGSPVLLAKDYRFSAGATLVEIGGIYSNGGYFTNARIIPDAFTAAPMGPEAYHDIESDNTARAMTFKYDIMYPIDTPDTLVGLHDSSVVPMAGDWTRSRYNVRAASGIFDARDSGGWATIANPRLATRADTVFHVKINFYRQDDGSGWFYDVWVAPEDQSPVKIAENFSRLADGYAYNNLNKLIVPYTSSTSSVTNALMLYTDQLSEAIEAVNAAQNTTEMASALTSNSLGLPLDIYSRLSGANKESVHLGMLDMSFTDDLEIRLAFDRLVRDVTPPPAAPQNVVATVNTSNNVLITWDLTDAIGGVRYYEVARCDGNVFSPSGCVIIARVGGAESSASDSGLDEFSEYSYAVRAVGNIYALMSDWSVPSAIITGATPVMIFDNDLVATAMAEPYDRGFTRRATSATSLWFINQSMISIGAPQYAIAEWADSNAIRAGQALRYLASVCAAYPQYEVGGKTVEDRVLEHIRFIIRGGNEWGCSGQGQGAKDYTNHVLALTIIKVQAPATFAKLTAAEQAKVDLLMEATLIGAHYATADANYTTQGGGVGQLVKAPWFTQDFDCTTGVDQTFNYHREWSIGHRAGILTAISAYYYFGGSLNGGADKCNEILAGFDYNVFMQRLLDAGFSNIYTVFGNAGNETEGSEYPAKIASNLQVRTRSSSKSDAGEYTYFGYTMDQIGKWITEYIETGLGGGPIRPYGGDNAKPDLTPNVQLGTNANNSIMRPFGYPGYIDDVNDNLLNFPNLGAPGMQMLFDTSDAGYDANPNDYGPDAEARGARSSLGYASGSIANIQMGFFFIQAFDGVSEDGLTIAGIPINEYADYLAQGIAGLDDFFYKASVGYHDYHKGFYRGLTTRSVTLNDRYQDDIWKNATDNKTEMLNEIKTAGSAAEVRGYIENPLFGLILFQYNALSDAGKTNVANAVYNAAATIASKKDLQQIIADAVAAQAVGEFNDIIAKPGVTADEVLDMLSVELRDAAGGGYTPGGEPLYNALGIFVYGFTDFYTYKSEQGQALRLSVSQYLIDNAPANGFNDRRAIRDAIVDGLNYVSAGADPGGTP